MDAVTLALMQYSASSGGGTTQETVTGNAPISLSDASAKPIVSLTQTGLCTQASTPTPSAPVDIKCNNGTLTVVDDELPDGYKRVLGFRCNNNAMWKIEGLKLRGSDTVSIGFSVTAACNVFGCYQGADATDNYDLYVSTTSNSKYLRYGNGTYLSYWSADNLGQRFDVVFTPTGTTGMPQDSTWTEATFESANDLLIGATTLTGTSAKLKGDLYGNLIVLGRAKLIPCERVSDNVLGYYNTYTNTFTEPYTGFDGAVSLGYDGSHYVLQTVGTPEVLTVTDSDSSTQAATVEDLYSIPSTDYADMQEIISGLVTRKTRIVVLDGTEAGWNGDFNTASGTIARYYMSGFGVGASGRTRLLSTHFNFGTGNADGVCFIAASGHLFFERLTADGFTTKDAWTDWLKAQYAAGTPLICVVPIADPTTESVTGQNLSTAEGTNTVSVVAEVGPVALEAVYKSGSGGGSTSAWLLQYLLRTSQRKTRP